MASFSPGRRRSCLIFVGWTMRGKRELQPELKLKSQTRRTARCAFMPTGSIRPSDWSAARAILAGYNGILFVPFSTAPFPYCGPFPAQDISSGESHWASRSHICRSTILQELARIIRLTSFWTASGAPGASGECDLLPKPKWMRCDQSNATRIRKTGGRPP